MKYTAAYMYGSGTVVEAPAEVIFKSITSYGYGHWKAKGTVTVELNGKIATKDISVVTTSEDYIQSTKNCESRDEYNKACEVIEQLLYDANDDRINEMAYDLNEED